MNRRVWTVASAQSWLALIAVVVFGLGRRVSERQDQDSGQ